MTAKQIKAKWINVTKSYHKKQNREYWELRGTNINKCFGKIQSYNPPKGYGNSYTFIRAMISTEDPFTKEISYTTDFNIINKEWEELMNQLLNKIFDTEL